MPWFYSDNPVLDAERYQAALDKEEEALPRYSICENPVTDGYYYSINDEVVCADCLEYYYRKEVEDYIA